MARPKPITVVIVEDHRMFREQLGHLIDKAEDMKVCGFATTAREGFDLIEQTRPNVAIVDISLKDSTGLELVKELRTKGIDVPVLVLSMHEESLYAERALRAGANGYITKDEASEEVMAAIRRVINGEIFLNPRFMGRMMSKIMGAGDRAVEPMERLADRELQVFRLIGRGLTMREIGEQLGLGTTTVDTYRTRIREKLHLENALRLRVEAIRWVQENE
jgi:DNA-binding NarL/FixJ family response regulator